MVLPFVPKVTTPRRRGQSPQEGESLEQGRQCSSLWEIAVEAVWLTFYSLELSVRRK